jgi:hypothetical protein
MVLNTIFLGGVWFIIHQYCFSLSFGGVGGWSEPNETNFI